MKFERITTPEHALYRDAYERCGFVENPYAHVHPAYHCGNAGHDLVVMSSPERLTAEEYGQFARYLQNVIMKNAFEI